MLQNCPTYNVMKIFLDDPLKKYSLKEISLSSKLAHTSVKRELEKLIKEGLIKKEIEKRGKRNFPVYYANVNEKFKNLKKITNEYNIRNSGLIEFLISKLMPNSIILFGSYSRGEDTKESDIDIFVESNVSDVNLEKFEKILKRKINLLFKREINEFKKELLNNLLNGRILYGEVKIK